MFVLLWFFIAACFFTCAAQLIVTFFRTYSYYWLNT